MANESKLAVIQVPLTKECIKDFNLDKKDIAWLPREGGLQPFLMIPTEDVEFARWYNNSFQREYAVERRERKCMVTSEKTGKLIRCDKASCNNCPYATTQLAYNSWAGAGNISYDQHVEDNGIEPASVESEAERVDDSNALEIVYRELGKVDPLYESIARMLAEELGIGDIITKIGYQDNYQRGYRIVKLVQKTAVEIAKTFGIR